MAEHKTNNHAQTKIPHTGRKRKKKSRLMNTFREEWLVSTGGVPTKIGRGKVGVRGLVTGNE